MSIIDSLTHNFHFCEFIFKVLWLISKFMEMLSKNKAMYNDIQVIIMAGGVGSRFWPMSTPDYPKLFIDVMGVGRSLIQLTIDRLKPICPVENMWVVTSEKYIRIVKEQIPDMPVDNILAEPEARNTAPCIAPTLAGRSRSSTQMPTSWSPLRCSGHQHLRISACPQQGTQLYI